MTLSPARLDRARRTGAAVVLFALAFLALAGARPLNTPDEGRYAEVAREMLVTGDLVTPRLDFVPFLDKPALFYWLDAAGIRLAGATPFGARLAPALLGALGCVVVLLAGARLAGWRAGLLGAVVLGGTPLWYGGAQYVNHDLAVATWITAATLALGVGLLEQGGARVRWLLLGGVASGLALLTKGLIGVVFPFGIVGLWLLLARRARQVPWLLPAGLVALAVAAPWYLACQRANPDFFHYFLVTQHFERFAGKGFNNPAGPAFYLLVVPLGLLPWTPALPAAFARAWRDWRADRSDPRGDLLLLLWPVIVVAFFSIPRSKIVGYVLPALPPLAMLLGRYWDEALDTAVRRRALAATTSGVLLAMGAALAALPWLAPVVDRRAPPVPSWTIALLVGAGVALLALGALAWRSLRGGATRRAVIAIAAGSAVLLAGVLPAIPALVQDGSGRLAARIRALRREGDAVVAYGRYVYDLPFLLDARTPVTVVARWDDPAIAREDSWRRELWLGRGWFPASRAWLVLPDELPARCGGEGSRCFVVARQEDVPALRASLGLDLLETEGRVALLASPGIAQRLAPLATGR